MALRTVINIQKLNENDGVDLQFVPVDTVNGMELNNTGKCVIYVKVDGTGSVTVEVPSRPDLADRLGDVSRLCSGPNVRAFGPYGDSSIWGDGNNLFIDFASKVGTVTIAAAQA